MKANEASNGTLLKALIVSFAMRETLATSLKRVTEQASPKWDSLADDLTRQVVESTHAGMKLPGPRIIPFPATEPKPKR